MITVTGEMTSRTRQALQDVFTEAAARGPFVVADIAFVDFRAPGDFEPLMVGRRRLRRAGGELHLVHPSEIVGRALDTLTWDQEFPVFTDVDAATRQPPPAASQAG